MAASSETPIWMIQPFRSPARASSLRAIAVSSFGRAAGWGRTGLPAAGAALKAASSLARLAGSGPLSQPRSCGFGSARRSGRAGSGARCATLAAGIAAATRGAPSPSSSASLSPSSSEAAAGRAGGAGTSAATAGAGRAATGWTGGRGAAAAPRFGVRDHRRRMALVRSFGDMVGDQLFHDRVARARRTPSHDDRDQRASVAMHRGQEVEAGGAGVAGLDAVDAVDPAEQMIVIADDFAVVFEFRRRKILEVARKALFGGAGEDRQVARGGELLVVGQAGGVAVESARHAESVRFARHHFGERALVAADLLRDGDRDVVGRTGDDRLDGVLDGDRVAGLDAELGRLLGGGVRGNRNRRLQRQGAFVELLEQQIERHHLGDARRGGAARSRSPHRACARYWRRRPLRRRPDWRARPAAGPDRPCDIAPDVGNGDDNVAKRERRPAPRPSPAPKSLRTRPKRHGQNAKFGNRNYATP